MRRLRELFLPLDVAGLFYLASFGAMLSVLIYNIYTAYAFYSGSRPIP